MIADHKKDKKLSIDSKFIPGSPAHMVMMNLMIDLYNSTPERPAEGALPDGAEEQMLAVLRYVGEASVAAYTSLIQTANFSLVPPADLYSIFKEPK